MRLRLDNDLFGWHYTWGGGWNYHGRSSVLQRLSVYCGWTLSGVQMTGQKRANRKTRGFVSIRHLLFLSCSTYSLNNQHLTGLGCDRPTTRCGRNTNKHTTQRISRQTASAPLTSLRFDRASSMKSWRDGILDSQSGVRLFRNSISVPTSVLWDLPDIFA